MAETLVGPVAGVIRVLAHTTPKVKKVGMSKEEVATLGGGCFWCIEAVLSELKGVTQVLPGYAGGNVPNPSYEQVCTDKTGHAEVVQVTFDPSVLSYGNLLRIFFTVHDPTTLNRQGEDVGTQYRSVVFYHSPQQLATIEQVLRELRDAKLWRGKIVTEVRPFQAFYPAEEYHRDYFRRNPGKSYCQIVIEPKVVKFREHFTNLLKSG